ncbi:MAG: YfhO family protein [Planctomycetes bacterium]|nr:YfhO family protein [Planctomycetota bacterium]
MRSWLPAAAVSACLAIAFFPVIFGGQTLATSGLVAGVLPTGPVGYAGPRPALPVADPLASALLDEPYEAFARRELRQGRLPLWNPHQACGLPLFANGEAATLDPLRMAARTLPQPVAWDAFFLARLLLAGIFMGAFVRARGRSIAAATFAGIAFALCGYFVAYVNMSHVSVEVLLPALLLGVEWVVRARRLGPITLAGFSAWAGLAGMPESLFLAFTLAGSWAIFRVAARESGDLTRPASLLRLAASFAAGLLLAAPTLLLCLEYLAHAQHVHSTTLGHVTCHPAGLVAVLDPVYFVGASAPLDMLDPTSGQLPAYIGVTVAVVALLGIGKSRWRAESWFFAGAATLYFAKAFGAPGITDALAALPLWRVTLFPKYGSPILAVSAAALASIGVERFGDRSRSMGILRLAILLLVLAIPFVVTALAFPKTLARVEATTLRPMDLGLAPVAAVLVAGVVLLRRFTRVPAAVAAALVSIPLAVELVGYVPRERATRHDAFTKPAFSAALDDAPAAARVISTDRHLAPNTATALGLDDVRFLEALVPRETHQLLKSWFPGVAGDRFDFLPAEDVASLIDRLSFLNVATILGSSPLPRFAERVAQGSGGAARADGDAFVQRAGSTIFYRTRVPRTGSWIEIDPPDGSPDAKLLVRRERAGDVRFEQALDPKSRAADRRWFEGRVDLSAFRGSHVKLELESDPGPNGDARGDLVGWSAIRLGGTDVAPAEWIARAEGRSGHAPIEKSFTIDGETRSVLELAAPGRFDVTVAVPADGAELRFAAALNPGAWTLRRGDLAIARVRAAPVEPAVRLAEHQRADLSFVAGETVTFLFDASGDGEPATNGDVRWPRVVFGPDTMLEPVAAGDASVYQNRAVMPRAFLVDRAIAVASSEDAIERASDAGVDLATTAFVEAAAAAGSGAAGRVLSVKRTRPDRFDVEVEATRDALLVTSETFYPGWDVTIDREPATIVRADGAFRAVWVKAGHHRVRFDYRPWSLRLGCAGAALGALLAIGVSMKRPGTAAGPKGLSR